MGIEGRPLGRTPGRRVVLEDPSMMNNTTTEEVWESGGDLLVDAFGAGAGFGDGGGWDEDSAEPSRSVQQPEGHLKCHACDPPCDPEMEYICQNAVKCFKSHSRDSFGVIRVSRGCSKTHTHAKLQCSVRQHRKSSSEASNKSLPDYSHVGSFAVECCDQMDFCNSGSYPDLPKSIETEHHAPYVHEPILSGTNLIYILTAGSVITVALIITGICILLTRRKHRKRMNDLMNPSNTSTALEFDDFSLSAKPAGDSTLKEFLDGSLTSGSGSGLPLLIQRTLAKNIQLKKCIGKGRYGEVWQGIWNCENVAVKIFNTRDELSWSRETEIYSTVMLRHENILGFYGSDMISRNSVTQLWLVTHYHRRGSLFDVLNGDCLSSVQLIKYAYSIANGLAFLHSEMVGTENRAGIAHRDIKSKNILVTSGDYCVIADFGLAVTHRRDTGEINVGINPKVGTRRYMAPEILSDSMNVRSFDSYKRADIYSFGLVLWEMCRRTGADAPDYQLPFYEIAPSDPSFEDMRKIVCDSGERPGIEDERWRGEPILTFFSTRVMKECWHSNPAVRPSALRLKKSIAVVGNERFKGVLETVHV